MSMSADRLIALDSGIAALEAKQDELAQSINALRELRGEVLGQPLLKPARQTRSNAKGKRSAKGKTNAAAVSPALLSRGRDFLAQNGTDFTVLDVAGGLGIHTTTARALVETLCKRGAASATGSRNRARVYTADPERLASLEA